MQRTRKTSQISTLKAQSPSLAFLPVGVVIMLAYVQVVMQGREHTGPCSSLWATLTPGEAVPTVLPVTTPVSRWVFTGRNGNFGCRWRYLHKHSLSCTRITTGLAQLQPTSPSAVLSSCIEGHQEVIASNSWQEPARKPPSGEG